MVVAIDVVIVALVVVVVVVAVVVVAAAAVAVVLHVSLPTLVRLLSCVLLSPFSRYALDNVDVVLSAVAQSSTWSATIRLTGAACACFRQRQHHHNDDRDGFGCGADFHHVQHRGTLSDCIVVLLGLVALALLFSNAYITLVEHVMFLAGAVCLRMFSHSSLKC